MKFVVVNTVRPGGSAKEVEEAVPRVLELWSKWTPPAGTTIHQMFSRADGNGNFAVVETDNATDLIEATSKFGPVRFPDLPVADVAEGVSAAQEGVKFRKSIS
jgi:hypothetical protein